MARMIQIHDGEDEQKTDALHDFMKDASLDWEGDNAGITIWLTAHEGDTIVVGDDGGLRIFKKTDKVLITRHAFRHVYEAMLMVEHDNGAHHANRIHPGMVDLDTFSMPYEYGLERLIVADEALARLREANSVEHEDLVIGEEGDQRAVVKKYEISNAGLAVAHDLINEWFNGWERPYKWEQP